MCGIYGIIADRYGLRMSFVVSIAILVVTLVFVLLMLPARPRPSPSVVDAPDLVPERAPAEG